MNESLRRVVAFEVIEVVKERGSGVCILVSVEVCVHLADPQFDRLKTHTRRLKSNLVLNSWDIGWPR